MAKETPKDTKTKQTTLAGFFGKPKPGAAPPSRHSSSLSTVTRPLGNSSSQNGVSSNTSPASSAALKAPSSAVDSSPHPAKERKRAGSPLKQSITIDDMEVENEGSLSPPPPASSMVENKPTPVETVDEAMDVEEESGVSRRAKRKVVYAESGSDSEDDIPLVRGAKGRKPRKSLKEDSDSDDFVFNDDDDAAMLAAAEEYEASAATSPSIQASSPVPEPKKKKSSKAFTAPKAVKSSNSFASSSSGPSRPAPRPLAGASSSMRSASASDNFLLTAAERQRILTEETKRENEQCFDFLKPENVRDKEGHKPDHADYDKRTILVPKEAWASFTPFEKQFWEIKQDHFDTVLFFQKGKFYELYEDDALIGHQEFDLKLTDRVKMKMVGVPEQSFDLWASKFLANGYKVGKVEQAETAIGMEIRQKDAGNKGKEIVRRELGRVFTNGTIVDGEYLSTHEANWCVAIKELSRGPNEPSIYGLCITDTSIGEFRISYFQDDIIRTQLETMFRQIRPKELLAAKGNLTIATERLLRSILPADCRRESFIDGKEFWDSERTWTEVVNTFGDEIPDEILANRDNTTAMEALGGLMYYLGKLNLRQDLMTQRNFNIYDPIREGKNLILDGLTLGHMEVLVNNEGGTEGTLLELLQNCATPFGKRLFRIWLECPLREAKAINARLDAVDDIMANPTFGGAFNNWATKVPDLERLVSRIHAGSVKQSDFLKVMDSFKRMAHMITELLDAAKHFDSPSVPGLLRGAPDLQPLVGYIESLYYSPDSEKTIQILPNEGADEECDKRAAEVQELEDTLDSLLKRAKKEINCPEAKFWHSAQGGKDIYNIEVPVKVKVPSNWSKQASTGKIARYITPETGPKIRALQEARERHFVAKRAFFHTLLAEFDKDRTEWLKAIRVISELDCLVSLAKASAALDEPKCRPIFVDTPEAFVDFTELRHPSMCLRSSFIANDVQLGGDSPRQVLLTGPNMAGKSTLLRMTAAGVILAQLGCYVPAESARLSPIDRIQTRMGAYDNMFSNASTFKVELDETSKILKEAGPRSLIILDELGRGTSTYDGMAIAGAVLHHVATHTLPLGFFATHYGSLTDDFAYHPNIRRMHMQTHVDDEKMAVVFLYKLIAGVAESSHGTHVAHMAGVPAKVVKRAQIISTDFYKAFNEKLDARRRSALPLPAHADFVYLMKVALGRDVGLAPLGSDGKFVGKASLRQQLDMVRQCIGTYEV